MAEVIWRYTFEIEHAKSSHQKLFNVLNAQLDMDDTESENQSSKKVAISIIYVM